jgi:peptide/nickel transport system substrate-binding protein
MRHFPTPAVLAAALLAATAATAAAQDPPRFEPLTIEPRDERTTGGGKYGGVITWSEPGEMTTFNPLVTNASPESELRSLIFDPLVSYDNGLMATIPGLAHKWEHSDDGLVWTFHLRKGVQWSDGKPFTADDVLFSFASCFHPKIKNSPKDGFRVGDADYPKVEKLDDFTVRFTLPVVNALFETHVGNVYIAPAHLWADTIKGDNPTYAEKMTPAHVEECVGTGPFMFVEYSGAERIVYKRNPRSWRQDKDGNRLPYVDGVIVLLAKDLGTRTEQFLAKNFDMITDIPAQDYQRFKDGEKEGWFKVHRLGLSLNVTWITLNQHPGKDASGKPFVAPHKLAWFQDARFRRAMSHASDREKIVKILLDGKGEAIYGNTTRGNKQWYAEHTKFAFDPAKAKALLDEMDLKDKDGDGVREDAQGRRVEIDVSTNTENPMRVGALNQLKADWAAVGVAMNATQVAFNDLVNQLQDNHRWEAIVMGWASGVPPDPLNGINIHHSSGRLHAWYPMQPAPANAWEVENDAILVAMQREPDAAKRKPLWAKYLELEAQGQNQIFLFAQNGYAASKGRVKGLRPSVLRPQTWYNVEELWLDEGK